LNKFYPASFSPREKGVAGRIGGADEIEKVALEVILRIRRWLKSFKAGDAKVLNFLIGQVMAKTQKRADFRVAREVLERFTQVNILMTSAIVPRMNNVMRIIVSVRE
jgi:hypothetical protein